MIDNIKRRFAPRRRGASISPKAMDAPGKTRILRFRSVLGSVNEVIACCDLAEVLGYAEVTEEEAHAMHHVRATLLNLVRSKH